jgi:hypothetical protein
MTRMQKHRRALSYLSYSARAMESYFVPHLCIHLHRHRVRRRRRCVALSAAAATIATTFNRLLVLVVHRRNVSGLELHTALEQSLVTEEESLIKPRRR